MYYYHKEMITLTSLLKVSLKLLSDTFKVKTSCVDCQGQHLTTIKWNVVFTHLNPQCQGGVTLWLIWWDTQKKQTKYYLLFSVPQDEFPAPDEFPVVDEFPSVLKWRRKPSVVSVSSSLPDLLGTSTSGLSTTDTPFKSEQPLEGDKTICTLTMQFYYIYIYIYISVV